MLWLYWIHSSSTSICHSSSNVLKLFNCLLHLVFNWFDAIVVICICCTVTRMCYVWNNRHSISSFLLVFFVHCCSGGSSCGPDAYCCSANSCFFMNTSLRCWRHWWQSRWSYEPLCFPRNRPWAWTLNFYWYLCCDAQSCVLHQSQICRLSPAVVRPRHATSL